MFEVDGITYTSPRETDTYVASYEANRERTGLGAHYLLRPMISLKEQVPSDMAELVDTQFTPQFIDGELCENGWLKYDCIHSIGSKLCSHRGCNDA